MNDRGSVLISGAVAGSTVSTVKSIDTRPNRIAQAALIGLYTCAIFTGAALVFLMQPMVAKMALPLFGGSPAVWNTSLVFFQAVLLLGYLYAHLSTRLLGLRRQSVLHLVVLLLPLVALPIRLRIDSAQPDGISPVLWLLLMLSLTAGLPFFVVSTAGPTLQRWFSGVNHPAASDPYFLYAASNAGSLLALLAYPLIVEPNLTLAEQGTTWTGLYAVFAGLCIVSAVVLRRYPAMPRLLPLPTVSDVVRLAWRTRLRWVLLAFVPSSLMVGVTNFITTDVASAPLLWILPLSIYLVTFILAFLTRRLISISVASILLAVALVAVVISSHGLLGFPIGGEIAAHLLLLFGAGMLCHTRLALQRPSTAHLTEFYLLISVGGVLGGAFNALVSPMVFSTIVEYPVVIVLALLLRPGPHRSADGSRLPWALDFLLPAAILGGILGVVALIGALKIALIACAIGSLLLVRRPVRFAVLAAILLAMTQLLYPGAIYTERTFFGVHRVVE